MLQWYIVQPREHSQYFVITINIVWGFPAGAVVKNPPNREAVSTPGSGRASEVENDNLLQYSCLGNPMNRGVWWATVHGVAKSWTRPSTHVHSRAHTNVV